MSKVPLPQLRHDPLAKGAHVLRSIGEAAAAHRLGERKDLAKADFLEAAAVIGALGTAFGFQ